MLRQGQQPMPAPLPATRRSPADPRGCCGRAGRSHPASACCPTCQKLRHPAPGRAATWLSSDLDHSLLFFLAASGPPCWPTALQESQPAHHLWGPHPIAPRTHAHLDEPRDGLMLVQRCRLSHKVHLVLQGRVGSAGRVALWRTRPKAWGQQLPTWQPSHPQHPTRARANTLPGSHL